MRRQVVWRRKERSGDDVEREASGHVGFGAFDPSLIAIIIECPHLLTRVSLSSFITDSFRSKSRSRESGKRSSIYQSTLLCFPQTHGSDPGVIISIPVMITLETSTCNLARCSSFFVSSGSRFSYSHHIHLLFHCPNLRSSFFLLRHTHSFPLLSSRSLRFPSRVPLLLLRFLIRRKQETTPTTLAIYP